MAKAKESTVAGGQLAVVLTGAAGHAAALLGALEGLEQAGLKPDLLVGASGGALAAGLYAATGAATSAREAYYQLVRDNSWQQLADLDFAGLLRLENQAVSAAGVLRGEKLFAALRSTPIANLGFAHVAVPLFVVTTDLNSGQAVVFGNAERPAGAEGGPYLQFARSAADLERVNVATAVRASLAVPGVFQPLSLDYYCLVDGGLRARQALGVAAAQPGIGRIIWLHAGLEPADAFSLVNDYAHQAMGAGLLQALMVGAADAFDPHTADPALADRAVRFVNLSTSSVSAADLTRTQSLYESGRRSVAKLVETAGDGAQFAGGPAAALATALAGVTDPEAGPRYSVTVGAGGPNTLAVTDRNPTLVSEFGYELDDYLAAAGLAKLEPREPLGAQLWLHEETAQSAGLWTLAGHHLWRGCGYVCRALVNALGIAVDALGLNDLWDSATKSTGALAQRLTDNLRGTPAAAPAAPAAPAAAVAVSPAPAAPAPAAPADAPAAAEPAGDAPA